MYIRLEFDKYKDVVEMEERDFLGTKFIITTIPRILNDSQFVCPRIRTLSDESLFDFMERDEVLFAVNGGIFNTGTGNPECVLVQNRKVVIDQSETYIHTRPEDGGDKREELFILGITETGNLNIYPPSASAVDIVDDGCIDALMGFVPLIVDGSSVNLDETCGYISYVKKNRQVICQTYDDEFMIFTVDAPGLTLEETRELLADYPIKLAYNLDGGKSTQTVFHKESLVPFYTGDTGRHVPTIITFEIITGELIL